MEGLQGDDGSGCLLPLPPPRRMERLLMAAWQGVGSTNRAWDRG